MIINFKKNTLQKYLDLLSKREPVPGGGSAAALTAAMGVALISMATHYSKGRKANTKSVDQRLAKILAVSESLRLRLLEFLEPPGWRRKWRWSWGQKTRGMF